MDELPRKDMENENRVLVKIHEGMDVFDLDHRKIGTVDFVQMSSGDVAGRGAATPADMQEHFHSILDDFAAAFTSEDNLSDDAKSRLLFSGFVRLDSDGLFKADRYILPEQIDHVTGSEVHLKARFNDLVHP